MTICKPENIKYRDNEGKLKYIDEVIMEFIPTGKMYAHNHQPVYDIKLYDNEGNEIDLNDLSDEDINKLENPLWVGHKI